MRARLRTLLPLGVLVVACTACDGGRGTPASTPAATSPSSLEAAAVDTSGAPTVVERAEAARAALAERDFAALADLVHPERGLRFSPYAFVDTTDHVVLQPAEVAGLAADTTTRTWGAYDGTGDPIRLRFVAYYDEFVYDRAFGEGERGAPGERLGRGNTISNIGEAFGSAATFVEYHVPGSGRYEGMDWASLRLVFAPYRGTPHLVGVVHDQWTI